MSIPTTSEKPRILVLHGFCDSAEHRQHQMRNLTRSMKDIEFIFIDSPFPFIDHGFLKSSESSAVDDRRFQWMSYKPEWPVTNYPYDTIKESVEYITDYIHQHGPFHGLFGFSQGAIVCIAAMLNISQWSSLPDCVKFIVLVGCPPINDPTIRTALETCDKDNLLPSLHVSGVNDTLIPTTMSEAIFNYFRASQAQFHLHKGGHYCPSDADFRQKLKDFIQCAIHS